MEQETLNETSQKWLNLSMTNGRFAYYAVQLSGLLIKHTDLIQKAIKNQLTQTDRQKIIDWIINNLPKSSDAERDSNTLETAWMIYDLSESQANQTQADLDLESNFLMDVRAQYLAERMKKGFGV